MSAITPVVKISDAGGLTFAQAEKSRQMHGSNELSQKKRRGFWRRMAENFGDPIIKILLAALAVNLLFMFHHFDWYESAGIAIAIFLATFVSSLSEYGSESAFEKLQEDAARTVVRVRRSGKIVEIAVTDIVVGDIVMLQAGERIPADGVLIAGWLRVDQSALNGESKEAAKSAGDDSLSTDFLAPSSLFRGSIACSGEGIMRVRHVGDATFYGRLAGEVQEETRESPLKVRLAHLAKVISRLGYAAAGLVVAADLFCSLLVEYSFNMPLIGQAILAQPSMLFEKIIHAVTLAITVIVVAVPEGLPMMITVVLSSNMRRMLRDHVLVRKLVGIETSGSLNILFSDKTGTLTNGKPDVSRFVCGNGNSYNTARKLHFHKPLWQLMAHSSLYNTGAVPSGGKAIGGNATDRALMSYVLSAGAKIDTSLTVEHTVPFDSARKFSAARVDGKGADMIFVKGAPEKILPACDRYYNESGQIVPLTATAIMKHAMDSMTGQAMRVLAVAVSETPVGESFSRLILIGLLGIRDELRSETRAAVAQVRGAGVQLVIVTGDNRETAAAIAREAGVLCDSGAASVITSTELAAMSDAELRVRLPAIRVVARALPSDKSRLVQAAQSMGLVAGMTGDGINDAPALKKADVGFAMGSGTDVAKEAGDIVILDDNICSIAKAVLYGRTIFKSIRKFIIFQLTMNLCAVGVSIIGPFIGIETPVTVIQMLWINIIMDTLAGLAFAGEPPLPGYMDEPPKRRDEPVLNRYMVHQIVCMGVFTVALCVTFLKLPLFKSMFRYDSDPVFFMTAFFALFIFTGVFNSFNARTHRLYLGAHLRGNIGFILIMAAVAVVQLLLIYFGGSLFRTAGLTMYELRVILMVALLVVPVDALRKLVVRFWGRKGGL